MKPATKRHATPKHGHIQTPMYMRVQRGRAFPISNVGKRWGREYRTLEGKLNTLNRLITSMEDRYRQDPHTWANYPAKISEHRSKRTQVENRMDSYNQYKTQYVRHGIVGQYPAFPANENWMWV